MGIRGRQGELSLILFFTYGVSLKIWAEKGLMDREILIYKRMVDKGVKVAFITYGDAGDYIYQKMLGDINIIPVYSKVLRPENRTLAFLQSFLLPLILRRYLRKGDIFKTNQLWGAWVAVIAGLFYGKKILLRCGVERYKNELKENHKFIYLILLKYISKCLYKLSDRVILTSHESKDFVVRTFRIDPSKISMLYNYIDIHRFRPMDTIKSDNKILFVGRLAPVKNIFSLLEAVAQTHYDLDIIGNGRLLPEIRAYIKKHDMRANLMGQIPNEKLPGIINSYPVFILPSYYEGNPKALLEAMACGCAVIGANVEGIKEVIIDGETGILFDNKVEGIREAIKILMANRDLRDRLGRKARRYVMERCDLEAIVDKEYKIYRDLVN